MDVPGITLNSGTVMPRLGFGVWQVGDDEATTAVAEALRAGYRLIDTAAGYHNEPGVGRAVAESGIARDELFITTKLANPDQGRDAALRAFDASLDKLGLDHVALYLIHWPIPHRDRYVET
ncbi:MAG TPA: aldo/keto reductase, partial [Phytomonospora sp.]